ncbi:Acriflavin resistance protein [Desulfamplus magnetovallimortis]|uniref:Acriflavin resistance protein n=1 Tax=Desulfamplus magnetovallimortis TaxID=1246637 RepID=A0A1W1HGA6_9BACT|nr:efflux RND transporter permease subunit [Desulfamplus magnetovallimortis]SLM31517.1 Acriflavin resistance protein [Desulfamplus magnetovallimortis]
MIISDTAVQKSTSVVVLTILIIIFGVYCYNVLPRESDPDITIPNVFVSTSYRGVSPSDMETSVTIKIESKLKGLDGLKKLQSVSSEGLSSINIEFVTGTDIDKAIQDVKDKVDEAMGDLPSDLDNDPYVFEVNFSEMPIVVFSLSGTCGLPALKKIADDLEDDIEAVTGVLAVDVTGGLEREIRVEVSPEKLAYYGLTIFSLQSAVESENRNNSGGAIRLGKGRFQLRVPGEFETPEEIYGLVLGTHQGQPVYLKDVAHVVDGFKEESSRSRLDGREAINLAVKKRSGENIIAISEKVDEIITKRMVTWPPGTEITKVMDKTNDIKNMVADLENNIFSGLILVLVVIFLAMGIRNALLVSLAIPMSMLLSFTVLYFMGITLNMVVLFSLTLALGMLVDNAIVIVENIYRFMEQGAGPAQAAMQATSEVAWPVIGSTLTTLAAFSPMLFWPGIMGEFMGYMPLTLIITLTSSLFVALIINPAMASLIMKPKTRSALSSGQNGSVTPLSMEEISRAVEKPVEVKGVFMKIYTRMLSFALDIPLTMIAISFCLLVLMIQMWLIVVGLEKPVEFFPEIEPKGMYVNVDVPEGADLDYIDTILQRVELALSGVYEKSKNDNTGFTNPASPMDALAPKAHDMPNGKRFYGPSDMKNIKNIYTRGTIVADGGSAFSSNTPNHVGVRFLELSDRWRSTHDTVDDIRKRIKEIPGGKVTLAMEEEGPPTGAPINIEIAGENFEVLGEIARKIKNIISDMPHVHDVRDDFVEGIPSVQVNVDRQKAALFGLTTDGIGYALKSAYNGLEVSSFREGDDDYDITVQLKEADRKVVDILHELMLPTPTGYMVPLSTLANVTFTGSIGDIVRINNERVVTVRANVDENKVPGAVVREQAEILLKKFALPPGYKVKFTGEFEFQQESEDFLSKAFLVALLLIFLILVSMFNSVIQPFVIMTSVILSLGGAFLGLALFNSSFGIIMTGVGVISLAGVVVNNAIVLIDYINKLRERGLELKDAVVSAGATRLRPVLLTAVTTILGLIPMVTGISYDFHTWSISWVSESSQWWRSMAVVVIFGLVVATFLTLVVVPTLYYLLERMGEFRKRLFMKIRKIYWKPYPFLAGEPAPEKN